jgi:hypothetical protein
MHLWQRTGDAWTRVPVTEAVVIGRDCDGRLATGAAVTGPSGTVVAFNEHGKARAALIVERASVLTLNGYPALPATVLADRDEIALTGVPGAAPERLCFGAYAPVIAAALAPGGPALRCARCQEDIAVGDVIVRCPVCDGPYHEGALAARAAGPRDAAAGDEAPRDLERFCWSYDPLCAQCRQPRSTMSWVPGSDGDDPSDDAVDEAETDPRRHSSPHLVARAPRPSALTVGSR